MRQPQDHPPSRGDVPAKVTRALALLAALSAPIAARAADPPSATSLAATIEAMPRNLPRAAAPDLSAAIDAARAAQRACAAKNAQVSVLIADSAGRPVVLLSGDGAGYRSQLIAQTKVNIVAKYGKPSGDVEMEAMTRPALKAEVAADPNIGMLRAGGYPVYRGGRLIGIVGLSGASLASGDMHLDEACAKVAVAALEAR